MALFTNTSLHSLECWSLRLQEMMREIPRRLALSCLQVLVALLAALALAALIISIVALATNRGDLPGAVGDAIHNAIASHWPIILAAIAVVTVGVARYSWVRDPLHRTR